MTLRNKFPGDVPAQIDELLSWRAVFLHMAWLLKLSIADVEREHAKTKKRTHPQNMVSTMAANSLIGQMRSRSVATRLGQPSAPAVVEVLIDPLVYDKLVFQSRTALQLFRADWLKEEKANGRNHKVASQETWTLIRAGFESLAPVRAAVYQQQAEATRGAARAHRRRLSNALALEDTGLAAAALVERAASSDEPNNQITRLACQSLLKPD